MTLTKFINEPCATVSSLRKKLTKNNFGEVGQLDQIEPGDIVFWEKLKFDDGSENEHIGFALNKKQAISTNYKRKCVALHDIDTPANVNEVKRKITLILRPGSN